MKEKHLTNGRHWLLILLVVAAPLSRGEVLSAGVGVWQPDYDGSIAAGTDLDDTLGISSDKSLTAWIEVDLPLLLLPGLRLAATQSRDSSQRSLDTPVELDGMTFPVGFAAASELTLNHYDVTGFYSLVDLGLNLDLGLTARYFSGELEVLSADRRIGGWLPAIYGSLRLDLPATGFYGGARVNAGTGFTDLSLILGWQTEAWLLPEFGISAGYRRLKLDTSRGDLGLPFDAQFSGPVVHLTFSL